MAESKDRIYQENLERIRGGAKKTIHLGAITEGYNLDTVAACKLLNRALATEVLCVLRYRNHQVRAKGINAPQVAEEFSEHAENEEAHAKRIAERINQLGGDPLLDPTTIGKESATEYGAATELMDMIRDDLVAERIVIEMYRSMIQWFGPHDPTTRRILEEILADEEEHATDLADLMVTQAKAYALAGISENAAS